MPSAFVLLGRLSRLLSASNSLHFSEVGLDGVSPSFEPDLIGERDLVRSRCLSLMSPSVDRFVLLSLKKLKILI